MRTTSGLVLSAAVAASLLAGCLTGCSDDDAGSCSGRSYQPDLTQKGSTSPIDALETWLGTDAELPDPPDDGWTVVDNGPRAVTAVITNDEGDGWWVAASKTESGGWVVDQATDDATGCSDVLPDP